MITQLEMPLRKAPAVKDSDLKTLVLILELNEQWFTAAELCAVFYLPVSGSSKRFIRALADAAAPEIISGQEGYRHITHATAEEIWHSIHWMESQASKMQERAIAYRRRGYELGKL